MLRLSLLISISTKKNEGSLEKWPIPCLGQEMCTMSLEYLVITDSKDANKNYQVPVKRTQNHLMRLPLAKDETSSALIRLIAID